jgi:hypothetical protein
VRRRDSARFRCRGRQHAAGRQRRGRAQRPERARLPQHRVIEADRTFNDAVQNAYRATRVFEYFSSQTYAKLGDLFLARMVSSGDHTLEAYLAGLGAAYTEFQQKFGQADTRVVTLSLKDDLLAIPKLGA